MNPVNISPNTEESGSDQLPDNKEYLSAVGDFPGPSLFDDFQWDIVNDNILDAVWPFWSQEEILITKERERTADGSSNQTQTSHSTATDVTISAQLESMFFPGDFSGSTPVSPISLDTSNIFEKANNGMELMDQCTPKEFTGEQSLLDAQSSSPCFSHAPGVPHQESYFDDFDDQNACEQHRPQSLMWERASNQEDTVHSKGSRKSKIHSFASATSIYKQQRLNINSSQHDEIHSESNGGLIHVYNTRKRKYQTNFNDNSDDSEEGRSRQTLNTVRGGETPDDSHNSCDLRRIKSSSNVLTDVESHQSQSDSDVLTCLHAMWSSITDPVGKVGRRRSI